MTVVRLEDEMPSEELVEWAIYDQLEAEDRAPDSGSMSSPSGRTKPNDAEDDE